MNTFFALALACTLSTAPNTDDKTLSRETATYVVTNKMAIWLTEAGKLKLSVGQHDGSAVIKLFDHKGTLYTSRVGLRKGIHQTFDLTQITEGTYHIEVTIGDEVVVKTIRVERHQSPVFRLG